MIATTSGGRPLVQSSLTASPKPLSKGFASQSVFSPKWKSDKWRIRNGPCGGSSAIVLEPLGNPSVGALPCACSVRRGNSEVSVDQLISE